MGQALIQQRYYQDEAVDNTFAYLTSGRKGNPLIALPTGTGKSIVIARIIQRAMTTWPGIRIGALTHVKELVRQNSEKLKEFWPSAPYGINSAGLKQRDTQLPILFAGIKSVLGHNDVIGPRHLLFIDEAHLLAPKLDSMYQQFIAENNKLTHSVIIGTTATPYRVGQGLLTDEGIFTDIVCDYTSLDKFNQLLADGFLSPLVTKKTTVTYDVSNVSLGTDGDFAKSALEGAVDTSDINYQVCRELVHYGYDRQSWLVFASGIKHAEHIAEMLRSFGITASAIHSKNEAMRDSLVEDFKAGKIRCLVNNNVLTTGFDHPAIDFIGMLRPTMSTGLWVQMLGRGTRPSLVTGKVNCLCLDFAGNTPRLGPINDPLIPRKKGEGSPGTPPVKICPNCGCYNHATVRICGNCGYEFPQQVALTPTAGIDELIRSDQPQYEWFDVSRMVYSKYAPAGKPPMLKATYVSNLQSFDELVLLQHTGGIRHKAIAWWKRRMNVSEAPPTVDEALLWTGRLAVPKRIQVWINKKFPEIVSVEL